MTLTKLAVAAILLSAFIVAELMQKRPMVDFALFRKPTFLGASVAMVGYAAAGQVMMTYLPLYLQNVFGFNPAIAGFGMLPFALPLFFFPRIAAALAGRFSGRVILSFGLLVLAIGNFGTAWAAGNGSRYVIVAIGMFVTGCGAGLLNGETAKVSMSVIPPERGGMASGITATLRFVGLVTAITGLGAVLSHEAQRQLARTMSETGVAQHLDLDVSSIGPHVVSGDINDVVQHMSEPTRSAFIDLAQQSFASGFTIVLTITGAIAAIATLLTFVLISATETAPISSLSKSGANSQGDNENLLAAID